MKKIIDSILFTLLFLSYNVYTKDRLKMAERSFEVAEKLASEQINHVIENADKHKELEEAIGIIRKSINESKNYYSESDSTPSQTEYRSSIYSKLALHLKFNKKLTLDKKMIFLDILSEGIINDNPLYAKILIVKSLAKMLNKSMKEYVSPEFRINIEKAYKMDIELHDRYLFAILVNIDSPIIMELLDEYSNYVPPNIPSGNMHESLGWAITLYRARRGEAYYVRKLLELAELSSEVCRFYFLFSDISSVHDVICVRYLHEYLKLDVRGGSDCVFPNGDLLASYAALALSKMLEGFPMCTFAEIVRTEDLTPYRKWMEEKHDIKFKPMTDNDYLIPKDIRNNPKTSKKD